MRITQPIQWHFFGDETLAARYRPIAATLAGRLQAVLGPVPFGRRRFQLTDGTLIDCIIHNGQYRIAITAQTAAGESSVILFGSYVLLPTSDTNKAGIPGDGYAERIIYPSWQGRNRAADEGGGNLDWRGLEGDILTWWGATGRYWHQWVVVGVTPTGPMGLCYRIGGTINVKHGRTTSANKPFNQGGLWHDGYAVQYDGSDLIDTGTSIYGASLAQFGDDWYLHYLTTTFSGSTGTVKLWQAPFDRDTHTATAEPVLLDSGAFANDEDTIFRPFLFNGSGTLGYALRRQEESPGEFPTRMWSVVINDVEDGGLVASDLASTSTTTTTITNNIATTGGAYAETEVTERLQLLAIDWVGDNPINITLSVTETETVTLSLVPDPSPAENGTSGFADTERTETTVATISWDGPYGRTLTLVDNAESHTATSMEYVFDSDTGSHGAFYNVISNDLTIDDKGAEETGATTKSINTLSLLYLDARYGIALTQHTQYSYSFTHWIEVERSELGEIFEATIVTSDHSYSPSHDMALRLYDAGRSIDNFTGDQVVSGSSPAARVRVLPVQGDSGTEVTISTLHSVIPPSARAVFQGIIAAHPTHMILSYSPRYLIDKTEDVFSALYTLNGSVGATEARLMEITGIDNDNEGYAPVRVLAAPDES